MDTRQVTLRSIAAIRCSSVVARTAAGVLLVCAACGGSTEPSRMRAQVAASPPALGATEAMAPSGDGGSPGPSCPAGARVPATDWGKAVVDATMKKNPPMRWKYQDALLLHGVYLVYQRVKDPAYLAFIKNWTDSHLDGGVTYDDYGMSAYDTLDSMEPSLVMEDMFETTKEAQYAAVPAAVRKRLNSYPRTTDGAFWHRATQPGQTWSDGVFMVLPQLVRYGALFDDAAYASDEATKQLLVYRSHLKDPNGLHYHAWAESPPTWSFAPGTKHSKQTWCRAVGWYGMATTMVLDALPANHPKREAVIQVLRELVEGLKRLQDGQSGRWWQVMDMGSDPANWLETSCSSMHTFVISRAVEQGYVAPAYAEVSTKGFQGVLQELSLDESGGHIADICKGTNVQDNAAGYYARPRAADDFHGLGAFLIMYEQLRRRGGC
jgi:unsaturated rhamnogalacturonyl hydrolase